MRRFSTLFWVISLFTFLFVLSYIHAYLPTYMRIEGTTLTKSNFFYAVIALITLLNSAILILSGAIHFVPSFLMPIPKRDFWMSTKENRAILYLNLKAWLRGLAICFNLAFIVGLLDVYDENDIDISIPTAWIYALIGILTMGWLVTYYFWFNILPKEDN
ncbi:MAG: hypothetical protein MUE81_20595 [Thermoflexibacter sp.]|nr:hypothetical protein [Thermoflexibacter sp.]